MLISDLREIKSILEIDPGDLSEDKALGFYIEWASSIIEDYLNRPGLSLRSRTEYYKGTGTQKLLLRSRPVYTTPEIQVWSNLTGYYGAPENAFDDNSALTYGEDFALQIDQDNGTSRSGILIKINGYWSKPFVRQTGLLSPFIGEAFGNIKVTYTGGYTVDNLPPAFRIACNLLVSKMRFIMPLGLELSADSYEDKNISMAAERKDYLLSLVKPLLHQYRNWKF